MRFTNMLYVVQNSCEHIISCVELSALRLPSRKLDLTTPILTNPRCLSPNSRLLSGTTPILVILPTERLLTTQQRSSGAAIGGFSLAAFLSEHSDPNHPIKVDIYESRPEVSTRGAGIGIWKRSWQVLQDLGLDKELDRRGIPHPKDGEGTVMHLTLSLCDCLTGRSARGPVFRKSDQPEDGYEFYSHIMPCM